MVFWRQTSESTFIMPTKSIFKKHYFPKDFFVGEKVVIYLDSRKQGERRVRQGRVLDDGLDDERLVRPKTPMLKLLVEKSWLTRGSESQLENNKGTRSYMYGNIKHVDFPDRENH